MNKYDFSLATPALDITPTTAIELERAVGVPSSLSIISRRTIGRN